MANTVFPPDDAAVSRKRALKWVWYVLAFGALIALSPFIWFSIWRHNLHREVTARIAAIRAQRLPVNWEDLAKWPSLVKDSENAAFIYTNAIGHLDPIGLKAREPELPRRGEPLSGKIKAQITADIEKDRTALDIAYSAEKLRKSRYPVDYGAGLDMKLSHLEGLKRIAYLLDCEALLKADSGDGDGAAKAISASLRASESLDNEPIYISQLVSSAIARRSCGSLEHTLCRVRLSDDSLTKLYGQLDSAEKTNRMLTGLIGERATDGELIRRFVEPVDGGTTNGQQTNLPSPNQFVWRFLGFFERDRNLYLRAMETNIQIISTPPPASLSLTNEMEKFDKQASSGYYIFSSLFLPSASRPERSEATTRSTLRTAIAAIAIERWRNAHNGTIPDSLDALVPTFLPAVPSDPYTGHPLKFKKLAKGYVVYSVGPDGQDDGGKEQPTNWAKIPPNQRGRYDITFTVER